MTYVPKSFLLLRSVSALTCGMVLTGGIATAAVRGAGDEVPGPAAAMTEAGQAVLDLGMAHDLIAYGRRTKTPEALITAALILHRNPSEQAKDQPAGERPAALSPADLLAEAKKLRADDKALADLVARALDAIGEQSRGSTSGPQMWSGRLNPGATQTITRVFKAREPAVVRVQAVPLPPAPPRLGERPTPPGPPIVRVAVASAKGQVIGQQAGPSTQIQFTPPETGTFQIRVTNVGSGPIDCRGFNN